MFDLDGTLIDSAPDIRVALNFVMGGHGLTPFTLDAVKRMIGDGAKVLVQRAFAAHGQAAADADVRAFLDFYDANAANLTVPYPGIIAALEALREAGHRLVVCTNKPASAARNVLQALGLAAYFEAVIGGDSTPTRKPDPAHLAAALAAIGAGRAGVMVGDHENDMAAARGLGIPSIFVTWGYGAAQGTLTAHAAAELPGLVARL